MSESVLFRLQAGRTRLVFEAVDAWKAGHEEALRALDAEALIAEASQMDDSLRRTWEGVKARAGAGQIKDFQTTGVQLREAFETGIGVMALVADLAQTVARTTGHELCGLAELNTAVAEARTWTGRVLDAWPWTDRPWPPLDRAAVEGSRAATERGEGEDITDMLARVKAGGPLVKV
jgi:hypothetical protein